MFGQTEHGCTLGRTAHLQLAHLRLTHGCANLQGSGGGRGVGLLGAGCSQELYPYALAPDL